MTDAAPSDGLPHGPAPRERQTELWVPLGVTVLVVLACFVTFVLVVALGVLARGVLPPTAAAHALLTATDLKHVSGTEIDNGGGGGVTRSSLQAYVHRNPVADPTGVHPSSCAENLEGWMAWAALDTPSYRGWKHDSVYQADNIVVDSATDFGSNIQQSRNFATIAAATAFMSAERAWYRKCAVASYSAPGSKAGTTTYAFAPITIDLGLDSIVEGSTDHGRSAPPHLVDVYLRNRNIVYVMEIATNHDPARGLDPVSLAIVEAAAQKLRSVG